MLFINNNFIITILLFSFQPTKKKCELNLQGSLGLRRVTKLAGKAKEKQKQRNNQDKAASNYVQYLNTKPKNYKKTMRK